MEWMMATDNGSGGVVWLGGAVMMKSKTYDECSKDQ
jgi:hypothetical protein